MIYFSICIYVVIYKLLSDCGHVDEDENDQIDGYDDDHDVDGYDDADENGDDDSEYDEDDDTWAVIHPDTVW